MASKFNSFLDSVAGSIGNPKGNLADYQHASRLYVDNNFRLAPKHSFLYHVNFELTPQGRGIIPGLFEAGNGAGINEIGMLVKRADLPKFTPQVETKKQYNKVKNVQTNITYDPVSIVFHDDNLGLTTALLQAYYRYYFADGNQIIDNGRAYSTNPDNTYQGTNFNRYKFGMDNNNPGVPFFKSIKISTLARGIYTTYTLVNPILTSFQHDTVDNSDAAGMLENTITVAYESVFYESNKIEIGGQGNPTGFGQDHYDLTPSSLSAAGGTAGGLGTAIGRALDLYEFIADGDIYKNPLLGVLMGVNLIGNVRNLSKEGLRQEGFNLLADAIGGAAGINVSGVAQTLFPKNSGRGGGKDLLIAAAGVAAVTAFAGNRNLKTNPAALASARERQYIKDYQSRTGGSRADAAAEYATVKNDRAIQAALDQKLGV